MIHFTELTTRDQLEAMQELERVIWDMAPIPLHQTMTSIKHGGLIIGAYEGQQLIGFSYGFPGYQSGQSYLCSHMLGIHPDYRSQKIGEKLKLEQQKRALEKGYSHMVWTYDPLESRNGYLNLSKLQAVTFTYLENCYGEMQDGLNAGLPSDRFEVYWPTDAERTLVDSPAPKKLAEIEWQDGLPVLCKIQSVSNEASYHVPIPKDFQKIKQQNPDLAVDWRLQSRAIFQNLMKYDYCAVELVQGEQYNHYVFIKKSHVLFGGNSL